MFTGADLLLLLAGFLAGVGTVVFLAPRRIRSSRRAPLVPFRPVHRFPPDLRHL